MAKTTVTPSSGNTEMSWKKGCLSSLNSSPPEAGREGIFE